MLMQIILLILVSLLGSGVLVRHRRVLTYLAMAGILFEAHWLFLTLLGRTLFRNAEPDFVFWAGSGMLFLLWLIVIKRFSFPRTGLSDIVAAVVTLVTLLAACLIFQFNSFSPIWKTHGFFNGDTATLIAITQKALTTNGLVSENPFAANGPLEYPSLLHSGLAEAIRTVLSGNSWLEWLPFLTYLQIFITVPIFFLLWEAVLPPPKESWKLWLGIPSRVALEVITGVLVLYVMMLSWESYVYPQGHFFLMGMFILMAALLAKSWGGTVRQTFPALGIAVMLGIVLLFSNAVTGTAAVLLKIAFDGLHVIKRGQSLPQRLGWLVGGLFWVVMFFWFVPGNGSLQLMPGFSYTAAAEMGRLAPILILVGLGIFLSYERKLFTSVAALGLMALALVTFMFSSRGIVIENASRFFYHAVLIAFPVAVIPLARGYYWFKREFMHSSRGWPEIVVGWGSLIVFLAMFLLPAGASVASTHDNLMFKDEQALSLAVQEAAMWISQNVRGDAVFLASPETPYWIPMLTGNAMLRSDFWLSPDDQVLADVKAAFRGSAAAQEMVAAQVDYMVIRRTESETWGPTAGEVVFQNEEVMLIRL